jgi:hemerythrin-like metal-binding protein
MPLIAWTNHLNVGVKLLNNDHKKLVILLNNLHDGLVTGLPKPALETIFEQLVTYTRIHHTNEEKFLAEAGYHSSVMHKQEHEQMLEQLLELQIRFLGSAQLGVEMEILHQLRVWLFKHIQESDQKFAVHLKTINVEAVLAGWKDPATIPWKAPPSEARVEQGVW